MIATLIRVQLNRRPSFLPARKQRLRTFKLYGAISSAMYNENRRIVTTHCVDVRQRTPEIYNPRNIWLWQAKFIRQKGRIQGGNAASRRPNQKDVVGVYTGVAALVCQETNCLNRCFNRASARDCLVTLFTHQIVRNCLHEYRVDDGFVFDKTVTDRSTIPALFRKFDSKIFPVS